MFAIYTITAPVLLIGGLIAIFQGSIAGGFLMIAAVVPLGIYFRVIMMRRCRDIGWPPSLPWVLFVAQMVLPFAIAPDFSQPPELTDPMALSVPLLLGFVDFVFSIVIGCIASKALPDVDTGYDAPMRQQARAVYGMGGGSASGGSGRGDRFDDAIARALDAQRRGESILDDDLHSQRSAPAAPGRPAPSFGRRIV
jgi:hypothetical protein